MNPVRAGGHVPALALLALLGVASCGTQRVAIATIDEAGAEIDAALVPCTVSDDGGSNCHDGYFCSRTFCASAMGLCAKIEDESSCSGNEAVCGCDHVAYFNDCLRRADSVSLGDPTQCFGPFLTLCSRTVGCPKGVCGAVSPVPIPNVAANPLAEFACTTGSAICWRLPSSCPSSDAGQLVQSLCGGTGSQCVDECTALQEGGLYQPCTAPTP
jgi:hypothetical protein